MFSSYYCTFMNSCQQPPLTPPRLSVTLGGSVMSCNTALWGILIHTTLPPSDMGRHRRWQRGARSCDVLLKVAVTLICRSGFSLCAASQPLLLESWFCGCLPAGSISSLSAMRHRKVLAELISLTVTATESQRAATVSKWWNREKYLRVCLLDSEKNCGCFNVIYWLVFCSVFESKANKLTISHQHSAACANIQISCCENQISYLPHYYRTNTVDL